MSVKHPSAVIQDLHNHIAQVQSSLEYLARDKDREIMLIHRNLSQDAPKLSIQASHSKFQTQKLKHEKQSQKDLQQKTAKIRENNFIQKKQIEKNKENLFNDRFQQSQKLKYTSEINDRKVRDANCKTIQEKRIRKQAIKQSEFYAKVSISEYHEGKRDKLRKIKEQESKREQQYIRLLAKRLGSLLREKERQQQKDCEDIRKLKLTEKKKQSSQLDLVRELKKRMGRNSKDNPL